MSASEMREITNKARELVEKKRLEKILKEDPNNKQLDDMYKKIREEADKGYSFLVLYDTLLYTKTELILKQNGFAVREFCTKDRIDEYGNYRKPRVCVEICW